MGALSVKLNRCKILIQAGLGLIGFSTLFFIFADNFLELLLLRTFQGIGVALTIPATLPLMTAIGFSIAFSMLMVGRLIFQIPLGHYSDNYGRKPFTSSD